MKVLLATDGSEFSENAARFLTGLNWAPDDTITLFHAIYELPFRSDEEFHRKTLMAVKKEIAPKIIDTAADILRSVSASVSGEIEESPAGHCEPDRCILDAARSSAADLIVMGSRGIRGPASMFLGSAARLVAIQSPVPVLVVKPRARAGGMMRILFATDGSDCSRITEQMLNRLPFADAALTIAHVESSEFDDIPARYTKELDEDTRRTVTEAIGKVHAASKTLAAAAGERLRGRFRNLQSVSRTGDPSESILSLAREGDFDVIAVGSRGLRGLQGMLGSVSRNILTHADCAVLIGHGV